MLPRTVKKPPGKVLFPSIKQGANGGGTSVALPAAKKERSAAERVRLPCTVVFLKMQNVPFVSSKDEEIISVFASGHVLLLDSGFVH
jgi:hypothetical protein